VCFLEIKRKNGEKEGEGGREKKRGELNNKQQPQQQQAKETDQQQALRNICTRPVCVCVCVCVKVRVGVPMERCEKMSDERER
jgi:hypothetical protein